MIVNFELSHLGCRKNIFEIFQNYKTAVAKNNNRPSIHPPAEWHITLVGRNPNEKP